MNAKLIGIGAAGNKAAIEVLKQGILPDNNIFLLNSTLRDVPAEYKKLAKSFSNNLGGCGKERMVANELILNSLEKGDLHLDGFFNESDDVAILVSSSEGGTGSGATTMLARYIAAVINIPVIVTVFTGFEEDARGLSNTVEYFKELTEDMAVIAISNKKFLDKANGNKIKAEKLANEEFANKVKIILGQMIVDSEQNIDETDLKKIITTTGLMVVEHKEFSKVKNVSMFNDICKELIDTSGSLDYDPTSKRMGVILNINEKTKDFIDWDFSVFKERMGHPFELYTHVQSEGSPEYIAVIASGINLPIDDIKEVYDNYMKESQKINNSQDPFFNKSKEFKSSSLADSFNSVNRKPRLIEDKAKKEFFNKFKSNSSNNTKSNGFTNTIIIKNANKDDEVETTKSTKVIRKDI